MMGENPNYWWSLNGKVPPPSQQAYPTLPPSPSLLNPPYLFGSSLLLPLSNSSNLTHHDNQDFPLSWSQLLMTGLASEEEQNLNFSSIRVGAGHVGHEVKNGSLDQQSRQFYYHNNKDDHHENDKNDENDHDPGSLQDCSSSWSSQLNPILSVGSSSTTTTMFDFSSKIDSRNQHTNQYSSQPSKETFTSGTSKRARVQQSSTQPPLKVRKEKLSDRISALHQLVSPFGKTDTASVLFEATAHIRFLEAQIEALSSPYMNLSKNVSGSMRHQHSDGRGEMVSRGLCLVPVSCIEGMDTTNMTNDGVEYWTPAFGAGF